MTIATALDALTTTDADFATLLDALYQRRYTGLLLLHVRHGIPCQVVLPGQAITLSSVPDPPSSLDNSSSFPHS